MSTIHDYLSVSLGVYMRYLCLSCLVSPCVPILSDHPIESGCDWSVFQVAFLVVVAISGIQSHGYEVSWFTTDFISWRGYEDILGEEEEDTRQFEVA